MSKPHPTGNLMLPEINRLISCHQLEEALQLTEQAILNQGNFYVYHDKKAEILLALGQRPKAARAIKDALKLCPDVAFLKERLAGLSPQLQESGPEPASPSPTRFCGIHDRYPDVTGRRKAEGGLRFTGPPKSDTAGHPLVSIITVVFNNPDSLERCIDSVRNQDYPNIEHIIIDGGSDEPTLEIIRKHESRLDYYVSEPDGGIYQGMNKGIRLARGQYVCLLNSDDFYDSSFVRKTVAMAQERRSALVFSDYHHGSLAVKSHGMDSGIFFGHLNINHGTFLVSRRCYDLVGPYSEDYRIISDAVWMRAAYQKGVRFDQIAEPLFTFADDGLSSGGSSSHRDLFISEVVRSYRAQFEFLTAEEARDIYLLRFNRTRLSRTLSIIRKYPEEAHFRSALANYVKHCFIDRDNFRLLEKDSKGLFLIYLEACLTLDIPKSCIRMATKKGCFSEIIAAIDAKLALRKPRSLKVLLHFVTVFSAPSETFIYDLLLRLEARTGFDNFVLYDFSQLDDIRPYAKAIHMPWMDFNNETRNAIYQHIFESLGPDAIIGHFALNTWKLAQRIGSLGIQLPVLSMTHGLDVFRLQQEGPYRDYILNQYAQRTDSRFTTVSHFLRDKLVEFGVPAGKIDLVNNTVNPRFRAHRKPGHVRIPGAPVKLLAIGRLIDWKGHRYLLEALSLVRARRDVDVKLTIVYANGRDLLQELTDQVAELKLGSHVEFIAFVDFEQEPDFFSQYDLFVHPSTDSDDSLGRTETFGMSVLEAIAAGLPVVVTDVGGVPEVVGEANRFARIVPHADPAALADAILATIDDPSCFEDNLDYADQRLSTFSEDNQMLALAKSIFRITGNGIEAALFSTSTLQGAGYAAYRLHRGLLAGDVVSPTIHTTLRHHKLEPGVRIIPHPTMKDDRWLTLQKPNSSRPNLTMFTVNHPVILNSKLAEWIETADVINLHWTARFLSIENIAYLTHCGKPVVITLRDMFPLTGGCHYFHGCEEWMRDCANCPQLADNLNNFPSKVLMAKRRNYNFGNLTLVALSQHSANIIRRAPLFRDCRIEVIPNSIETEVFRPRGKKEARERLGLPQDRRIIAFAPSYSSEVKGYREAKAALVLLKSSDPDLNPLLLLVGRKTSATDDIPFDQHNLGYIGDTEELSYAYSAADVVIVPSLEETFSNTTAEAISCGTPVVGFKTGAIPEMAIDGKTGYTVEVGDVSGFAIGIAKVLRNGNLGPNCRKFAEENLRFDLQARRYEDLFTELVALRPARQQLPPEGFADSFPETTPTLANLLRDSKS
ncbi:MAG: glycosyltransferase [Luteolibacter sp.]